MQCRKCTAINDPDARFCIECGTRLDAGLPEPGGARTRRVYLYVLLLVPVIAVAIGIGYYKFFLPRGIAATVNGEQILVSELDAAAARMNRIYSITGEGDQAAEQMRRLRYHVLNGLITERLLLQEAQKAGTEVTDHDAEAAIEHARKSSGMEKDKFDASVIEQFGSTRSFEEAKKRELIINKFIAEKIVPGAADAEAADAAVDDWIQKTYAKATVRITLAEQWAGAGCQCCSNTEHMRKPEGCSSRNPYPASGSTHTKKAAETALKYWHEKHGPEEVTTSVKEFGCHSEIDIIKGNKKIGSLRYQAGSISEP